MACVGQVHEYNCSYFNIAYNSFKLKGGPMRFDIGFDKQKHYSLLYMWLALACRQRTPHKLEMKRLALKDCVWQVTMLLTYLTVDHEDTQN